MQIGSVPGERCESECGCLRPGSLLSSDSRRRYMEESQRRADPEVLVDGIDIHKHLDIIPLGELVSVLFDVVLDFHAHVLVFANFIVERI